MALLKRNREAREKIKEFSIRHTTLEVCFLQLSCCWTQYLTQPKGKASFNSWFEGDLVPGKLAVREEHFGERAQPTKLLSSRRSGSRGGEECVSVS